VVPRRVIDHFGVRGFVEGDRDSEGVEDRSVVVEAITVRINHDAKAVVNILKN
jgi:hypothetical protein